MRIAVTLERLEPARGGLEAYAAAWLAWLCATGVSALAVTLRPFEPAAWPGLPAGRASDFVQRAAPESSYAPGQIYGVVGGQGGP